MALDKLVDSAQLDACLEAEADAIRAKTGGSSDIPFDYANNKGFADAIASIQTGGGDSGVNVIKGISQAILYHETGMPAKYIIETPLLTNLGFGMGTATHNTELEEIEVAPNSQTVGCIMNQCQFNPNDYWALKKIDLNFLPISNAYQFCSSTYGATRVRYLESVLGLNFSFCGGSNYSVGGGFSGCAALKNVTLKPNCLGKRDMIDQTKNWLEFPSSPLLTDDSLISIANGLCADYTSKLVLHATPKARCSQITGNVTQITDDSDTYDFFTADANGAVSLTDFITTTKGWTLA